MPKKARMTVPQAGMEKSLAQLVEDVKLAHRNGSPKSAAADSLEALLLRLMRRIPAARGVLLVPDENGGFEVARAFTRDGIAEDRERYKFSRTLAKWARDELKVFIYNVVQEKGADPIPTAEGLGGSVLVGPVWDGTRVLAVLQLCDREGQSKGFSEGDIWALGAHSLALVGCLAELGAPPRPVGAEPRGADRILGNSPAITDLKKLIRRLARSDLPILIEGESGVGKEIIATALHEESPRRNGPFVDVNAVSISDSLFESQVFGHEKGAFTGATEARAGFFELANGGTLFFDEAGEIPVDMQKKFLRIMEQKAFKRIGGKEMITVDVRFVSATNQDIHRAIAEERLREDFVYRLRGTPIVAPPLRERGDDVLLLARRFIETEAARTNMPVPTLTPKAITALRGYHWPGNVRELKHLVHAAIYLADEEIDACHLKFLHKPSPKKVTREAMEAAVKDADGNVSLAATRLGIHRQRFYPDHRALRALEQES